MFGGEEPPLSSELGALMDSRECSLENSKFQKSSKFEISIDKRALEFIRFDRVFRLVLGRPHNIGETTHAHLSQRRRFDPRPFVSH